MGEGYEVLCVDDGSTDATPVVLQRLRRAWPEVRVVRLRANAGHQAAISAGLARARGRWVVTLDADLQDPPEVIGEMLAVARGQAVDVVYGVRQDRSTDTTFKRLSARLFYRSIRALSDVDAHVDSGDFRLMSRATVDAVNSLPEHSRVLRLVVPALHFPNASVKICAGGTRCRHLQVSPGEMIRLSLDRLTGFSIAPLRFATWMGLIGGVGALAVLVFALASMLLGTTLPGWTSTVVIVAAVGAVQLLALGILGEYVGRTYTALQARPAYFVAHDSLEGDLGEIAGRGGRRRRVGDAAGASDADLTVALDDPLVVVSSGRAIGPRAWSFWVEMPISAPNPNSPPSVKRVLALTMTAAASTSARTDGCGPASVTMPRCARCRSGGCGRWRRPGRPRPRPTFEAVELSPEVSSVTARGPRPRRRPGRRQARRRGGDALAGQRGEGLGEERGSDVAVDQERLGGVAHARALGLGVDGDGQGLVEVGRAVDVDVAVADPGLDDRDGRLVTTVWIRSAPPRGISRSTSPRALMSARTAPRPSSIRQTTSAGSPWASSDSRSTATVARLVSAAALPPRRMTALPDFSARPAASTVTLGRAS